jgi:glycosyltransferase involved in cell wall biosynthesis
MALPTVSIVVATHNRQSSLNLLIEALRLQEYPAELIEIFVIDDGSEPPAQIDAGQLNVRILRQPQAGPASARNAGIRAASSEFLLLTDDDCRPRPDWVAKLCRSYLASPNALLGGHTENALPENPYSSASQALVDYLYESLSKQSSPNYFFTTSNVAGPRAGFLSIQGFDESFPLPAAEDRDLCDRWNGPLLYVPDAIVDHAHPMALRGFIRQQFRYGRGARFLHMKRSTQNKSQRVEGLQFYFDLFTYPFRAQALASRSVCYRAMVSWLFFVIQVCNTAGYFYESWH